MDNTIWTRSGTDFHYLYNSNKPFPHIVLDNFLPSKILQKTYSEISDVWPDENWVYDDFNPNEQNKKEFWPYHMHGEPPIVSISRVQELKDYCPTIGEVFNELTSTNFLRFLSELTGIDGLLSDPFFNGGGIHRTSNGGHLNIHSDYVFHGTTKWYRRINLLLYLTPNWQEEWGGNLELWETDMSSKAKDVLPIQNRAIIFNTTTKSFHGHPHPLQCPNDIYRYSIALYYFTIEPPDDLTEDELHTSAQWKYI